MSNAMRKLQTKIGANADGEFGPNTARAIVDHYKLSSERGAHLLGQASHESGEFKLTKENLNYSVPSMMRVWPSRFPSESTAKPYARNPKALADKVYSGRMGNEEGTGDGSLYIGRGFLQLTGKNNYEKFAAKMGAPQVMEDPSLVETDYAFETAQWYFDENNLWKICDKGVNDSTIKRITKRVNGGYHGLTDRATRTKQIYSWLNA
jgi:putative chitinase